MDLRGAVCSWCVVGLACTPAGGGSESGASTGGAETATSETGGSSSTGVGPTEPGSESGAPTSTSTGVDPIATGTTVADSEDDPKFDLGVQADAAVGSCQELEVVPMPQRTNVALVLDYSSSMQALLGNKTRWAVLWEAVNFLIGGWDEQLNLGMMTFPDLSAQMYNSCVTTEFEVPVAPMNGANILAVLPGPGHAPPGNTPTRAGVLVAADHLETLDPAMPRAMILVTDGDALCGPGQDPEASDQGVDEVIGEIYSQRGIPVYVIGLAAQGDAFIDHLNEMGLAGGVPDPSPDHDYYPGDDPASLQAVFEQVAQDVLSCVLDLEEAPGDPAYFKVKVDGVEYTNVEACDQGDGWAFVPGSMNLQIELCGAACLAFKGGAAFQAKQYCPNG